jgi:diguanylate cyclase (GGDEF)-like protein
VNRPEIPHNEQERLATLRSLNVLDTLPDERFDRLTRLARRLFGVPIALVSLVDENRQWFKSCDGLNASETSRDISFCGHAILGDDVFVIPDAREDKRFENNPLVINAPNIRFYAGCPLSAPNGHKLGTLCLIDSKPRQFSVEDVQALEDLSAMVEQEFAAMQLATIDELTGISNRRGFVSLAQYSLDLCLRQNKPASIIFMDLNGFKLINDNFGHQEGDHALVYFVEQLKSVCRDSDILARLGGDEFVALLSGTPRDQAQLVVDRLVRALSDFVRLAGLRYHIVFSHGIVEFSPDKHNRIEDLMAESDVLMYKHKKSR